MACGCPDSVFEPANGNDLVILHICKDRTDSLRLDEIGNDFIDIGKKQEQHYLVKLLEYFVNFAS